MAIKYTTPFNLPYPDIDDPVRNGQAAIEGIAKGVNTALQNANIPPGNPNLNDVLNRLNIVEGKTAYPTAWANLTVINGGLISGFTPVSSDASNCRYRLHSSNTLELYCYVSGTFNRPFGKLPVGYRPAKVVQVQVAADNGAAYVLNINTTGDILLTGGASTSAVCYIMLGLA